MGVTILTSFITTFMGSALNLSIPSIDAEFGAGSQTVNWVVTAYMLTCTGLAIPFGYLADSGNRSCILKIGIAIFTVASVFAVIFDRIGMLILFRGLQGVGAAMIFSSNIPFGRQLYRGAAGQGTRIRSLCQLFRLIAGPCIGRHLEYKPWLESHFCQYCGCFRHLLYGRLSGNQNADSGGAACRKKTDLAALFEIVQAESVLCPFEYSGTDQLRGEF